ERWAIAQEALMQSGHWQEKTSSQYTIGDMISRYLDIVTPTKRGRDQEERRLQRLLRDKQFMSISLDQAHPCIFADFRDHRIHDGVRACQYDLVLMRHAWNTARIEWGWPLPDNPISLIRMPKNNPPRERRLKDGEFERLKIAAEKSRSWYLWPVVVLAIETAMRRGEILGLRWEHIDLDKKTVFLPMTKNGSSRWVPQSDEAIAKLSEAPKDSERPFPVTDVAFRQAWDRLRHRANINDLTFHDLRHEAISRMFDSGMKIHEVMAVSGHKTASQLFRYVQIAGSK
ncbi:site-specific integrase, partial [Alphaproteobacteria bacterium]|nr:site-specific integrase [Alphaproteobacteria bacterium]